jgi:hypothetical protein
VIVLMHFGDGTFKEINMGDDVPADTAADKASEWVRDNSWFQAVDSDGNDVGDEAKL